MDFKKTGQFIQIRRKEKELTQRQLAELLEISDKTVSKWETGRGIPDVTLMPRLCQILEISVNELLSGEALSAREYPEKAEVNMISLMENLKSKRTRAVLSISLGAALIALILIFLMWVEFSSGEWHLLNWFYEPYALLAEGLVLGAFYFMSAGMEAGRRFQLAGKLILSTGAVISLFPLEVALLKTDGLSQLNPLTVGTCLMPLFYAGGIHIVLVLAEVIWERFFRKAD